MTPDEREDLLHEVVRTYREVVLSNRAWEQGPSRAKAQVSQDSAIHHRQALDALYRAIEKDTP